MTLDTLSTYPFPQGGIECYYHTGTVQNALDIVANCHLFGSIPSRLKDKEDLKTQYDGLAGSTILKSSIGFWKRLKGQKLYIKNIAKNKRFRQRIAKATQKRSRSPLDAVIRCVCMAEAEQVDNDPISETTFWKEYAGNFSGVRFKFRIDQYFAVQPSCDKVYFDKVKYDEDVLPELDFSQASIIKDLNSQLILPESLEKLFYKKSEDFHKEYEYRFVNRLKYMEVVPTKDECKYFFKFDRNHLINVDIGINANETISNKLYQELSQFNIPVHTASMGGASVEYNERRS